MYSYQIPKVETTQLIVVSKPVHEFLTAFIISVNLHLVHLFYVHHPTLFVFTYAYKTVPPLFLACLTQRL